MTYEELPNELKERFDALMAAGRQQEAMALLKPPKPLTPEEQAKVDEELRKREKSNKRFSKFITLTFIAMIAYIAYTYINPV